MGINYIEMFRNHLNVLSTMMNYRYDSKDGLQQKLGGLIQYYSSHLPISSRKRVVKGQSYDIKTSDITDLIKLSDFVEDSSLVMPLVSVLYDMYSSNRSINGPNPELDDLFSTLGFLPDTKKENIFTRHRFGFVIGI